MLAPFERLKNTFPPVNTLHLRHIVHSCYSYQTALDMISSGIVNVKQLVTHRFRLEQTLDAYKAAMEGTGIKVMISSQRG